MYKFPLIELLDRYCISRLKFEKLGSNKEELDFYIGQLTDFDMSQVQVELDELTEIHRTIWGMEDDFKRYTVEEKYSLEEVGRRAIAVRNTNSLRYALKNKIADKLNDPVREMKRYG
jgi:hypothetical protein